MFFLKKKQKQIQNTNTKISSEQFLEMKTTENPALIQFGSSYVAVIEAELQPSHILSEQGAQVLLSSFNRLLLGLPQNQSLIFKLALLQYPKAMGLSQKYQQIALQQRQFGEMGLSQIAQAYAGLLNYDTFLMRRGGILIALREKDILVAEQLLNAACIDVVNAGRRAGLNLNRIAKQDLTSFISLLYLGEER